MVTVQRASRVPLLISICTTRHSGTMFAGPSLSLADERLSLTLTHPPGLVVVTVAVSIMHHSRNDAQAFLREFMYSNKL